MLCTNYGRLQEETSCVGQNRGVAIMKKNIWLDGMLKAVNLGDDTDTVAAIAGGLAGLYYGYEEIPKDWLAVIKKREWIEGMCEGLE